MPQFKHIVKAINKNKLKEMEFASIVLMVLLVICTVSIVSLLTTRQAQTGKIMNQQKEQAKTLADLKKSRDEFEALKNTDQVKRNDELESTVKSIHGTYNSSIAIYESLQDLPTTVKELPSYRKKFALILKYLGDKNYASGAATIQELKIAIDKEKAAIAAASAVTGGVDVSALTANNTPPGSGYNRQRVDANGESYAIDLVAGNLSNTRVIVDTASDSDCKNDCPTLPLGTYVSRSGAYAGINGSYFCPADYPSCAGKANSFDTLAMNKNKHYFNSENNVYSTVPAVIFGGGFIRFVGQSLEWGRDTGVDGVLANQPLMVSGGNVTFGGDGDPKKGSRGNRSFVANKGNTVYIGVVRNATVIGAAQALKALGMDNALNLDSGGSTALWASGGYKAGPGRNIPNAILFVNR